MYVFDYGAPVGFRVALRHPEWIAGIVAQNGNAYDEGLSDLFKGLIARRPDEPGADEALRSRLTPDNIRAMHAESASDPELSDPDTWTLDEHFISRPGCKDAVVALMFDYHSNIEQYPQWQQWLRSHMPPTLVIWGEERPDFPRAWRARLPSRRPRSRGAHPRHRPFRPRGQTARDHPAYGRLPGPPRAGRFTEFLPQPHMTATSPEWSLHPCAEQIEVLARARLADIRVP